MKKFPNKPIRFVLVWVCALGLFSAYLAFLRRVAPEILVREDRTNHGGLYALADRNYRRVRELRWTLPAEEKVRLLDEAVEALKGAVDQRPESHDYLWYLGRVLYARAFEENPPDPLRVEEALGYVARAWELTDREWETPGSFLAVHYAREDQPEKAESILERLLSIHPESPDPYTAMLNLLLKGDRRQEAIALLERKREKLSLSASDLDRLARLNLRQDDYPAAIESLEKLVTGGAGESRHYLLLAGALRVVGDFEGAFRILRAFVEALGPQGTLRPLKTYGLPRYPEGLFPSFSYLLLEGRLGPLP